MNKWVNFKIDNFLVESSSNRILIDGEELKVRKKVTEVLLLLAESYPNSVSRAEMIESLWDGNNYSGNKAVTDAIFEVRQALNDDSKSPKYIETVPKVGYRLLCQPEPILSSPKTSFKRKPLATLVAFALTLFLMTISFKSVLAKQKVIPPFQPYEVFETYKAGEYQRAAEMAKAILAFENNDFDIARLNYMVGGAHLSQDEYLLAVEYYEVAKKKYCDIGHGRGFFNSMFGEASARMYLEEWDLSRSLFLESMNLGKKYNPFGVRLVQRALCQVALRSEQWDEALMWSESLQTDETNENAQAERLIHGLITAIQLGDVSVAYKALESVDQFASAEKLCNIIRLTEISVDFVEGNSQTPNDHAFLNAMLTNPNRDYLETLAKVILDAMEIRGNQNQTSVSFFMQ